MLGTQGVLVSADQGGHWTQATAALPSGYAARGVVYSTQGKAFYAWHFSCGMGADPVPEDAIIKYDFDAGTP
jgi:hypothetical protein